MNDKCSNGYCKFDSYTTTKNKIMFKIKENDIFAKNMNKAELYQVWTKLKEQKGLKYLELAMAKLEMDEFLNKLIAKNGTTNY